MLARQTGNKRWHRGEIDCLQVFKRIGGQRVQSRSKCWAAPVENIRRPWMQHQPKANIDPTPRLTLIGLCCPMRRWGSPPPRPHVEQGITSVGSSQRSFAVKWEGWLFYVRVIPWAHWLITHSSSASSPSSLHKLNLFTRSSGTCRNMSYGGGQLSFCAEQDVTRVFTRWRNEAWHWCVHLINLGVVRSRNLVVIHTEWLRTRKVDYKDEKKSVFTSLNQEDRSCLIRTEETF